LSLARRILDDFRSYWPAISAIVLAANGVMLGYVNAHGGVNGIVNDLVDYHYGHVYITPQEGQFIKKSDYYLVTWLDRVPYVEGAAPRLNSMVSLNSTLNSQRIPDYSIPVIGVDPYYDSQASTMYQTVTGNGNFIQSKNDIVLGSIVARDLGGVQVGDSVKVKFKDINGHETIKRFTVVGISYSNADTGFDNSVIVHIDTLREVLGIPPNKADSIIVRLYDPTRDQQVKELFLGAFPSHDDKFWVKTVEEVAEPRIEGSKSNLNLFNLFGYLGVLGPIEAVMLVTETGISKSPTVMKIVNGGSFRKRSVIWAFMLKGMEIALIGIVLGTVLGVLYFQFVHDNHPSFNGSIYLAIDYDWSAIIVIDLLAYLVAVIAFLLGSLIACRHLPKMTTQQENHNESRKN
jgi:lipoprotein-releasing system permease protein